MKKLFLVLAAAFAMVACQTDINEVGVVADGVVAVEFEVGTPQMRAYSDGLTVDDLQYAVYEVKVEGENKTLTHLDKLNGTQPLSGLHTNVQIELANNKKYAVIFWADDENAPYTFHPAEKTVTVVYDNAKCNDESRDAFYAYKEFEVKGAATIKVELRRPFAQVNVGTSDLAEAAKSNFVPETSSLKVKNVFSTLNLVDGTATDNVAEVTFAADTVPTGEEFKVAGHDYLAMSYVLVGKDKGSYDVTYSITAKDNTVITNTIGAVPMQANYRTNIYGKLLTSTTDVNVEIKPGYNEEDNNVEAPVVVAVATAQEFNEAIANAKVGEIVLSEDITLDGSLVFGAPTRASNDLPGRSIEIDGNGKTLKVTKYDTGRVIDFTSATNGASLTLKNLTIENNVSWIERIVNYNTNGTLTLEGVKIVNAEGCSNNYAINLPAYSDKAKVVIKDSEIWAGANALNIWGEKTLANITNSKLYVVDSNAVEGYSVVSLNNSGENAAHYSTINVEGGEVKVIYEGEGETKPSSAFRDATVGSTINISESTVVVGEIKIPVVNVVYEGYNEFYSFTTLQDAIDKVQADKNGTVRLIKDLVLTEPIVVAKSEHNVVLDLNGHTLSGVDNGTASYGLITNNGNLTIEGPGKLELTATIDRDWNAYSSVISNQPGGNLVVEGGVVIEHLGGTDMAYGIDNLTNGKGTYAVTVINGATIKSTYSSVRQFLNGVEATNELYVNAGTQLVSPNRAVFFQDPSKNPNTGKLYIDAAASVTGKVHLSVTEGSTEWPVEVSVASAALINGSQVTYSNVPAGYQVIEENGVWTVAPTPIVVESAAALIESLETIADGATIILSESFDFTTTDRTLNSGSWYDGIYYVGDKSFTIDLGGKTVGNANGAVNDYLFNFKNDGTKANTITIKNGTLDAGTEAFCALCSSSVQANLLTVNLEDVHLINNKSNGSTIKWRGGAILNVKAGTKITGENSYLGIECVASTVNIYDGAEIYQNGTSSYNGCLVGACGNGVVNVYGGYGKGVKGCFIAMTSGGTINVAGGEWIANTDGTVGDNSNVYALTAQNNNQESGWCAPSIINVTGGTLRGGMDAWILHANSGEKAELHISGGNFNANPTSYLYDGATATENNGIWTVTK
ncbi:MAG: hypothetical protein IKA07_08920 [Alistipes sp.]|nr:hypothetical protein [Alistipes sp.]